MEFLLKYNSLLIIWFGGLFFVYFKEDALTPLYIKFATDISFVMLTITAISVTPFVN